MPKRAEEQACENLVRVIVSAKRDNYALRLRANKHPWSRTNLLPFKFVLNYRSDFVDDNKSGANECPVMRKSDVLELILAFPAILFRCKSDSMESPIKFQAGTYNAILFRAWYLILYATIQNAYFIFGIPYFIFYILYNFICTTIYLVFSIVLLYMLCIRYFL